VECKREKKAQLSECEVEKGIKRKEEKKLLMKKDLIAFLCKFNSILIASTTNG
jgi:hypothetical protein